jgi:hypothetical protein
MGPQRTLATSGALRGPNPVRIAVPGSFGQIAVQNIQRKNRHQLQSASRP